MKRTHLIDPDPSVSSPPSLSTDLLVLYEALSSDNKRIFVKVYRYLWGVVCPLSRFIRFGGLLRSFWVVDLLMKKHSLCNTDLSMLSFLYQVTNQGKIFVRSSVVYDSLFMRDFTEGSKSTQLTRLKTMGYINRSYSNPDQPYLYKTWRARPVFVSLSSSGVALIESIERDIHNILMRTSLDELRGKQIKKP